MGGPIVFVIAAILCLFGYFLVLLRRMSSFQYGQTAGEQLRRIVGDWRWWLPALILFLAVVAVVLPMRGQPREGARRARCLNNLNRIGTAFHYYSDRHGSFPPALSTDASGNPLHSWRVLLLPYMEEEALYEKLKLDEPWNSPHNKKVFASVDIPDVYSCPSDPESNHDTDYVMVVGPGTISDGPHGVRREQITDEPEETILVVEMANSGICWAEPRDLEFDEMSFEIDDPDARPISSHHVTVAYVLCADGSVHSIPYDPDPEVVKALLTIAGGEESEVPW